MAGRIHGITVEIGGDTTKLQTALKGVNTEIRNTQSQLKDVDKLLKLDPGNTDLLAQKHRLLAQAVSETKEKLETLKTAAAQADEALKNGTITQEQYDGLQREIAETEAKLKSLEEQANQSATALQKIAADGEKLKTMGDNVTNVGKKFLPVTGAVTALGTAAVKTAADFDSGMSRVSAISGATGSDLDALREKARKMGTKTKFSASEAASAMEYMAMAGWKTEDMLGGIEGVMNLAAAFTTSNNSFGPTEISYLENRFCNLALDAGRYEVKNGNDPTSGNITEEKESELKEFVDYSKLIMGTLGHKVFVPLTKKSTEPTQNTEVSESQPEIEMFLTRTIKKYGITVNASAKQTGEGFVVLKGSIISPEDDHTISSGIKKRRETAQIDENHVLQEDVLFNSPSSAAMFVIGKSSNGWEAWKTKDGKTLHDLEG